MGSDTFYTFFNAVLYDSSRAQVKSSSITFMKQLRLSTHIWTFAVYSKNII